MEVLSNSKSLEQRMCVKDPAYLLRIVTAMIAAVLVGIYFLHEKNILLTFITGVLPCYVSFLLFKVQNEGYVIDLQNNLFSYPGGKEANEVLDYVNLDWWLQKCGFKRSQIKLSEITRISTSEIISEYKNKYIITFEGEFGSIKNSFTTEGKRDQLYALLAQSLNMGDPMVIR